MDFIAQEHSVVLWTVMTLAVVLAAVVGKTGLGVVRAYYILRVRAGEWLAHCCAWHHRPLVLKPSLSFDVVAVVSGVAANSLLFS